MIEVNKSRNIFAIIGTHASLMTIDVIYIRICENCLMRWKGNSQQHYGKKRLDIYLGNVQCQG